jgi:hypothetical protein
MSRPAINAVGTTSIDGLFSLLKRCSLLVTNDTGTMHFAAAGGVPSLMLCVGPAFFRGTGPYSAGNLAMQADIPCAPCRYNFNCPTPVCRDMLTVDAVFKGCSALLMQDPADCGSPGVKIYRSFFDAEGYLDWERCDGGVDADEDLGKRYGRLWRDLLDDDSSSPTLTGVAAEGLKELALMSGKGIDISRRIASAAVQKKLPLDELRRLGDAETELAGRIKIRSTLHPDQAPLVDFFSLMRDNVTAEELPVIAQETRICYEWLRCLASRL